MTKGGGRAFVPELAAASTLDLTQQDNLRGETRAGWVLVSRSPRRDNSAKTIPFGTS